MAGRDDGQCQHVKKFSCLCVRAVTSCRTECREHGVYRNRGAV